MKRNLSYLLFSVAAVLGATSVHAQEADTIPSGRTCQSCVKFDYSVKFKSRHVWNGHQSCNAWNFQPNLNISFKGLYFNVWAYTPVAPLMTRKRMLPDEVGGPSPLNTEIDFTLGFAYGPFAVEYYDFFYIDEQTRFNYLFRWREADKGNLHQQWAQVWFNGVKQFPVSITAGIFTFGGLHRAGWAAQGVALHVHRPGVHAHAAHGADAALRAGGHALQGLPGQPGQHL